MQPREDGKPRGLVLVVDDFRDGRELAADLLSFAGYEVEQAENGESALAMVAKRRPDVVVTDLSLPDIDGCEISRRLKSDPSSPEIKVIVLTAHGGESYEEEAKAAGCDRFMVKPTPPQTLIDAINEMMENRPSPGRKQARKE